MWGIYVSVLQVPSVLFSLILAEVVGWLQYAVCRRYALNLCCSSDSSLAANGINSWSFVFFNGLVLHQAR